MAFYSREFVFDNTPSSTYSLTISSADNAESKTNMPGDVKLLTQKLHRRTDEFLYGVSIEPILSFDVLFTTDNNELSALDLELIGKWLFGRRSYSKLRILQPDMEDVYFDCIFTSPKIYRVGNEIRGVEATVHCKDAWALTNEKVFTYTYSPNAVNETITHGNLSDDSGYTYPTLIITVDNYGGNITFINTSDSNRTSTFTALQANEILTINNNYQTLSSSTGLKRLSNFNKNFFRLKSGKNIITLNGACSSFVIKYPMARKIGG